MYERDWRSWYKGQFMTGLLCALVLAAIIGVGGELTPATVIGLISGFGVSAGAIRGQRQLTRIESFTDNDKIVTSPVEFLRERGGVLSALMLLAVVLVVAAIFSAASIPRPGRTTEAYLAWCFSGAGAVVLAHPLRLFSAWEKGRRSATRERSPGDVLFDFDEDRGGEEEQERRSEARVHVER